MTKGIITTESVDKTCEGVDCLLKRSKKDNEKKLIINGSFFCSDSIVEIDGHVFNSTHFNKYTGALEVSEREFVDRIQNKNE